MLRASHHAQLVHMYVEGQPRVLMFVQHHFSNLVKLHLDLWSSPEAVIGGTTVSRATGHHHGADTPS